jgi:hypothetical protein
MKQPETSPFTLEIVDGTVVLYRRHLSEIGVDLGTVEAACETMCAFLAAQDYGECGPAE